MYQKIFSKVVFYLPQILALLFIVGFAVYAWTEPTSAPPGGNVATPLNVGPTGQSKAGGLILNTGGAVDALIIDRGNVCIGGVCRPDWPSTDAGVVQVGGGTCDSGYSPVIYHYASRTCSDWRCGSCTFPAGWGTGRKQYYTGLASDGSLAYYSFIDRPLCIYRSGWNCDITECSPVDADKTICVKD